MDLKSTQYIEKIGSKYYLFVSYGGFAAKGGYNMRVFASDKINGPYKDVAGNDARYGTSQSDTTSTDAGNTNGVVGERLMSYYKWSYLDKGRVAEGHNSAVADDDSDILDLRAFRPGDNLNHIHWNLSLRTDDLIVRQYGEQIDVKKVILVDLSILNTAQYRSRMDAVYTAVASIANLYVENEVNTLILAWNGQKQSAEYLEVHDRTELNRAMIRLMQIPCSSRAGEHAAAVYLKDIEAQGQQALFVTAGSYENNKVRIVNVEKIQLQELIDELWEKI